MKNLEASEDKMRRLNDQLKMKQQLYEERRQTIANYNKDVEMAQFEREREARRPKTAPTGNRPCCPAALLPSGRSALGSLFGNGWHSLLLSVWQRLVDSNGVRRRWLVLLCAVGPATEACERQPVLRPAN